MSSYRAESRLFNNTLLEMKHAIMIKILMLKSRVNSTDLACSEIYQRIISQIYH